MSGGKAFKFLVFLSAIEFGSSVEIQCEYRSTDWEGPAGFLYSCEGKVVNIQNPSIVTKIRGTHAIGKNDAAVGSLSLNFNKNLTAIPKDIERFFPRLTMIRWAYGELLTLSANDLKQFPNLVTLIVCFNKLTVLESDLFKHTKQLKELYLNSNNIQIIRPNLLSGLNFLIIADLSSNPCINIPLATTKQEVATLKKQLQGKCEPIKVKTAEKSEKRRSASNSSPPSRT